MLEQSDVATRLPAQDLERARTFYSEKLGLEPVEERPGGLRYRCGSGSFALFESAGAASGTHTQMGWEVADLEATVAELRKAHILNIWATSDAASPQAPGTYTAPAPQESRFLELCWISGIA